ncbi:MAG: hypothetical protein GXO77_12895 [Calditrichaeota bacterium]|nr:hypothetical protein [Calditrichota bacterium]
MDFKKKVFLSVLFIFLLIVILSLPIRIPQSITIPARLLPSEEWLVIRKNNSQISSIVKNHVQGRQRLLTEFTFERGDQISLQWQKSLFESASIDSGEPLGVIRSELLNQEITDLKNDILVKESELTVYASGEKQPLIEEMQHRLEALQAKLTAEKQILERKRELLKNKLISQEEYDVQQAVTTEAQKQAEAIRSKISALKTGAKTQRINFIKAQLAALQDRLAILTKRRNALNLIAPFSGRVVYRFLGDTLLHVYSVKNLVALVMVPASAQSVLIKNSEITLINPENGQIKKGTILSKSSTAITIAGKNFNYGYALIPNSDLSLFPGMILKGKIVVTRKKLNQIVLDFLRSFL